jgi:hypothetical protein
VLMLWEYEGEGGRDEWRPGVEGYGLRLRFWPWI